MAEQDCVKEVERGVKVKVKVKKNFESSTMVSFQRMKEDFDDISTQVGKTNKTKYSQFPRSDKSFPEKPWCGCSLASAWRSSSSSALGSASAPLGGLGTFARGLRIAKREG